MLRTVKLCALLFLPQFFCCVIIRAGAGERHEQTALKANSTIETHLPGRGILGQVRCASENLYLRIFNGSTLTDSEALRVSVKKVGLDGKLAGQFAITDAGSDLLAGDFFVRADNKLFETAFSQDNAALYLVSFSPDGRFQHKTKLALAIEPYQVGVYKSGEVLVSGLTLPVREGVTDHAPVTAIFRLDGTLIKKITFPEDHQLTRAAASGDPDFVSQLSPLGNLAVEYGDIVPGLDGNMYLMRHIRPALIYAISPRGNVVHTLRVNPSDPNYEPVSLRAAGGELVVVFRRADAGENLLKVIDLRGHELASYRTTALMGEALGCFAPHYAIFAGTTNGNIELYRVPLPQQ